jgi:ankyrin repeat protein
MSGQKFMVALQGGNIKAVKKIITSSGFDASKSLFPPNSPQTAEVGHYPPIVAASESGSVEIVRCLLDNGAAVDAAVGVNGMTGLYIACQEVRYN